MFEANGQEVNSVVIVTVTNGNGHSQVNSIGDDIEIRIAKFNIKTATNNGDLIHSIYLYIYESYAKLLYLFKFLLFHRFRAHL